jgi:tetratricopeptide (TPR) repeat protein
MTVVRFPFIFLVFGLVFTFVAPTHAQLTSGQISRVGDATHLEFSGRREWNYDDPVKNGDKLTFVLPAFDQVTETRLRSWACSFVKEIQIDKNGPDNKYAVTFVLNDQDVETFDYQTDDPSHLVIDFYKKSKEDIAAQTAPTQVKPSVSKTTGPKAAASKGARKEYTKVSGDGRKPAGDELLAAGDLAAAAEDKKPSYPGIGVFDGSDPNYDRFLMKDYEVKEEAIISSQQNIYIKFPMLKIPSDRFVEMMQKPPIYEVQPSDEKENKEARFIIKMFNEKKWGSFADTYNYFMKQYPNTKYDEIMRNMFAESKVYEYLEKKDLKSYEQFRSEYRYLIEKYPDSVLTERNLLLLGQSALHRNDGTEALQHFERYLQKYPESTQRDRVQFGVAEAYNSLYKPEDALKTYALIEKNSKDANSLAEAAFRRGDVSFGQGQYKKAEQQYAEAIKKYPAWQKVLPNAQYNLSEAQFWQGSYKESLASFVEYLKRFPNHNHGGFALARIGELLQILGADQQRVTGAFIEGYFRFPQSQGSEISRIRMLAQAFKGMREKEKVKAQKEIEAIAVNSKLPRMDEFATLTISDGLSRRGENPESLKKLVDYYQAHPSTSSQPVFRSRILRNISDIMKKDLEGGDFMKAMNIYGKFANTWLKNSDRVDIPYFRALSYEKSGVYNDARKGYTDLKNKLAAIQGTTEEKKRKIYENLPSLSQIYLRLAAVSLQERQYQDAISNLQKVKGGLGEAEEIEKTQIGAQVAVLVGNFDQAIGYYKDLVSTFKGQPEMLAQPYLSLADLSLKKGQLSEAEDYISRLEKIKQDKKLSDEMWATTLESKAQLQIQRGQKVAAVETLVNLLEQFENQRPMSSVRYKAGQILFDEGDVKGAEKLWSGLTEDKGQFYKKLAQEKMKQAEWSDSYKKYIDRIPAASAVK